MPDSATVTSTPCSWIHTCAAMEYSGNAVSVT